MRPYADRMQELMVGTAQAAASVRNLKLLQQHDEVKRVGLVLVTGDRGLAGPFNGQVLRRGFDLEREARAAGQDVAWLAVGRKGASSLKFRRYELAGEWAGFADKPNYHDAQAVGHRLAELYESGEVDRVLLVYNEYVSPLVQRVNVTDLLPVPLEALTEAEDANQPSHPMDFFFEPEPRNILERLLPVYVETQLYRALLESAASFFGAQMTAMRNASKAAGELIDTLTLAMNRARQAEITQEILEVVAGADALTQ